MRPRYRRITENDGLLEKSEQIYIYFCIFLISYIIARPTAYF
jgi:hypothetical protein